MLIISNSSGPKPVILRSIVYNPKGEFTKLIKSPISTIKDKSREAFEIYMTQMTIDKSSKIIEDFLPNIIKNPSILKYTNSCIYPLTSLAIIGGTSWQKGKFDNMTVPQAILDTIETGIYYNISSISEKVLSSSETINNLNNYIFDYAINFAQESIENETLSSYALKGLKFIKSSNPIVSLCILALTRGIKELISLNCGNMVDLKKSEDKKKKALIMFKKQEKKREEKFLKNVSILQKIHNNPRASKQDRLHCEDKLLRYGVINTKFNCRTAPQISKMEAYGNIRYQPIFE